MKRQPGAGALILLLLALGSGACGQAREHHLDSPATGPICRSSAYLHGYLHGYEEGYRLGDLDIHLSHRWRLPHLLKRMRPLGRYEAGFGDRQLFQAGFGAGFGAAYQDARLGRAFRGLNQLRAATDGLRWPPERPVEFDEGLERGYAQGRRGGRPLADAEASRQAGLACLPPEGRGPGFCQAFIRGFGLANRDRPDRAAEAATLAERPGP